MIDILVGLVVLSAVGAFVWLKVVKPKLDKEKAQAPQGVAPPPEFRTAYPIGARYTPPDAPVTDNASGQAFRDSLAPSTRAFMRDGAYFDAQGRPLDVQGKPITPQAPVSVDVAPAATADQVLARGKLEAAIRTGNPYSLDDIRAAGFRPDGAEFSAWHYAIKKSMQ